MLALLVKELVLMAVRVTNTLQIVIIKAAPSLGHRRNSVNPPGMRRTDTELCVLESPVSEQIPRGLCTILTDHCK